MGESTIKGANVRHDLRRSFRSKQHAIYARNRRACKVGDDYYESYIAASKVLGYSVSMIRKHCILKGDINGLPARKVSKEEYQEWKEDNKPK